MSTGVATKQYVDDAIAGVSGGTAPVISSFEVAATAVKAISNVNFNTFAATNGSMYNVYRQSSSAQNDEVVFLLPQAMLAGTWSFIVTFVAGTSFGIYTLATSADGSSWTDIGTVDSYAASSVPFNRTEVTGVTMPAGQKYLRLKIATKNASSSGYTARLSGVSGTRTGA